MPGGVVGAGTLLTPEDVKAAKAAGARFGVSPGVTDRLVDACEAEELPLLGGVATVGEAMRMLERGYEVAKFFPAEANGGAPALKAFAGPLPQVSFCPTGGVTPRNAPDYLRLPNVLCVGGSWVAEASLLRDGRWDEVTRLARMATMPLPLLEMIVNNNTWLQVPQVRRALLSNARLDQPMILRVLRFTPPPELKLVPKQTAYPTAVRSLAKTLLARMEK